MTFQDAAAITHPYFFGGLVPVKISSVSIIDASGEVSWQNVSDDETPHWLPVCTEVTDWQACFDGTLILSRAEAEETDALLGWQWAEVEKQAKELIREKARR